MGAKEKVFQAYSELLAAFVQTYAVAVAIAWHLLCITDDLIKLSHKFFDIND